MRVEVRLQVGFRLIVFAAANIGERRRQRTSADCRSIATERQLEIVKRRDRFASLVAGLYFDEFAISSAAALSPGFVDLTTLTTLNVPSLKTWTAP